MTTRLGPGLLEVSFDLGEDRLPSTSYVRTNLLDAFSQGRWVPTPPPFLNYASNQTKLARRPGQNAMQQRGRGRFGYANNGASPISVEILLIAY